MSIIEKAEVATTAIQEHVGAALGALQHGFNGRLVNGHGVYADPSSRHRDLLEARKAIYLALSVLTTMKWPTDVEYEHAEQA